MTDYSELVKRLRDDDHLWKSERCEAATTIETLTRELAKMTTRLQHESALTNARDTELAELSAELTDTKARLAEAVGVIQQIPEWVRKHGGSADALRAYTTFLAKQEASHGSN